MTATTDRAIIRALFERWVHEVHEGERRDLVPELVAPVEIRHERGESRQVTLESYAEQLKALDERTRDRRVQVHDMAIEGDRCWWRGTWTHTVTESGARQTMADLGIYRVEDGKFAEVWGWPRTGIGSTWPEFQAGQA